MKESSPPVSAMATPTNSSGNVVDEFEEAFQHCLNILTKEEALPVSDKDEVRMEVEQTTLRFVDLARQMEAFFLQKRFLLSALKPEIVVKEDINELQVELERKSELLKRHYEKINIWQNLLSDMQGYAKSPAGAGAPASTSLMTATSISNMNPVMAAAATGITPNVSNANAMSTGIMQQQLQQQLQQQQMQQQLQQQQLQQQQQMQQQMQVPAGMSSMGGSASGLMMSSQQAMFMQQQQAAAMGGPRGAPFGPQSGPAGVGGVLQGPLAYLEKTTSNIDLVAGMTDGRR